MTTELPSKFFFGIFRTLIVTYGFLRLWFIYWNINIAYFNFLTSYQYTLKFEKSFIPNTQNSLEVMPRVYAQDPKVSFQMG